MKRPPAIHPLLCALFPVLFLYVHNIELLTFNELAKPILLTLIAAIFSGESPPSCSAISALPG
ncbi:MAG: hypothetical protein ACYDBB_06470 [Armatimonadota bacterium]